MLDIAFQGVRISLRHIIIVVIIMASQYSCLSSQFQIRRSIELTDSIESLTMPAGYNYYYSGPEAMPDAVLGVKNGYQLVAEFWKPVENLEERVKEWHLMIGTHNDSTAPYTYYASYIFDKKGDQIGIWYAYTDKLTVKQLDEKSYKVYTPTPRNLSNRRIFLQHIGAGQDD